MNRLILSSLILGGFILYSFQSRLFDNLSLTSNTLPAIIDSRLTTSQTSPSLKPPSYNDGHFTGSVADAYYGNIQVAVTIQNRQITSVDFLQSPNRHGRSIAINSFAKPLLSQEAITAQDANVDVVSGATDTSRAFVQSLTSALEQAKG